MINAIDLSISNKIYRSKKSVVKVLDEFKLEVSQGDLIAVIGESGAGKTSLLNILGLLDKDFKGEYHLFGEDVSKWNDKELSKCRNRDIGFVLQESALIESLSIEENIMLPVLYSSRSKHEFKERFDEIVGTIGITDILKKLPLECSGGEKARAVFARAIIMQPRLLLCDEPTSSLDEKNKLMVVELLRNLNLQNGTTIITVTHDLDVAKKHNEIIEIKR